MPPSLLFFVNEIKKSTHQKKEVEMISIIKWEGGGWAGNEKNMNRFVMIFSVATVYDVLFPDNSLFPTPGVPVIKTFGRFLLALVAAGSSSLILQSSPQEVGSFAFSFERSKNNSSGC